MHRPEDTKNIIAEAPEEAMYFSTIAAKRLGKGLRNYAGIIELYISAQDGLSSNDVEVENAKEWEEITLSEEDSEVVFHSLRAESALEGDSPSDSIRRLKAFSCLAKLDLLGISSFAALG